jgi:hypothetical protein
VPAALTLCIYACLHCLQQQLKQQSTAKDRTTVQQAEEVSATELAEQQQQQQQRQQRQQPQQRQQQQTAAVQADKPFDAVQSGGSDGNGVSPTEMAADVAQSVLAAADTTADSAGATTGTASEAIANDADVEATLDAHAAALADAVLFEEVDEAVRTTVNRRLYIAYAQLLERWIACPAIAEQLLQVIEEPTVQKVLRALQQYNERALERGDLPTAEQAQYAMQQLHTAITVCTEKELSCSEPVWPPGDSSVLCEWQQLLICSAQLSSDLLEQVCLALQ